MRTTGLIRLGARRTRDVEENMRFDKNLFKDSAVITVDEESFHIAPTHWMKRRRSWSSRWEDVVAIDAMWSFAGFYSGYLGFFICMADGRSAFIADDMDNWDAFKEAVRKKFPGFDWENFNRAKSVANKRFPCWKRPG
jgi:hypothetical protein